MTYESAALDRPFSFPNDDASERANRAATFYRCDDPETIPSVEVCGVMVGLLASPEDGALVVTVSLETANPEVVRPDNTVPLRIEIHGRAVFDDSEQARREGTVQAHNANDGDRDDTSGSPNAA